MVLVDQQVVQLLLETRLGFVQLLKGGTFLLHALVQSLQVPLKSLLTLLCGLQATRVLLHLLLHF